MVEQVTSKKYLKLMTAFNSVWCHKRNSPLILKQFCQAIEPVELLKY